jgi:hypothetical protein
MSIVAYRKIGLTLVPADAGAREQFAKIKDGQTAFVEIKRHRNMVAHRRYFAELRDLVEATGEWDSMDALWFDIALDLKRGHPYVDRHGNAHWVPQSRACAAMAGDDFDALTRETTALVLKWGYDIAAMRQARAA